MTKSSLALATLLILPFAFSQADVKLPAIISDHMVLEKTAKVPIWGKADPGEEVTVTLDGQTVKTQAGDDGKWKVTLDLSNSGPGPFTLTVQGKNKVTVDDVVVGEVWVASGQSNMEWVLKNTTGAEQEAAQSANPLLRQFLVKKAASPTPLEDCEGKWTIAGPETTPSFTAVGYYFAKKLQNELKVPVGLIHTSWGGTPSEAWTSLEGIDSVPDLKATKEAQFKYIKEYPELRKKWVEDFGAWLKANDREDKAPQEVAAFAVPSTDNSGPTWTTVNLPGEISLPQKDASQVPGAIWVRQTFDVPAEKANAALGLDLGAIDGFDSVYWNGKLIHQTTLQGYAGTGFSRRGENYRVPADLVKAGPNTLAIRVFTPTGTVKFSNVPRVSGITPSGDWQAATEYTLPALTAKQLESLPKTPNALRSPQGTASHLFNGMINPILPYAISGVIWYQGESNAGRAYQYRTAFPLLITDWRRAWGQGDFPFYFCQLANYQPKKDTPGESSWAELREAQSLALSLPKTGQAVLIDIGEAGDIHPRNKKDVGERLARIALANDYGRDIPFSGPVYDGMKIEGNKVRISFKHTEGGLVAKPVPPTHDVMTRENKTAPTVRNSPNSELEGFAICGEDRQWVWADARIDGDTVVVWSDKVAAPVAVRYGWAENPTVNLYNGAGLPASPFRTDDFPPTTLEAKY
jgi:sialate O-acetylesterase